MRVAILEDEAAVAALIERTMRDGGHACHVFKTGKALLARLRTESFDLLLLDWNLPDMTGLDVLAQVGDGANAPPAIMITSRSQEGDIVRALTAGADDYVVKPVQPAVLEARVAALLRRAYPAATAQGVEELHGARFDHAADRVLIGGQDVQLTSKEFALALALFRNVQRPLSRAHLLETVWGHQAELETRTLDTHVSRLRVKLGLRPEQGWRLATVYSFGYRLESMRGSAGAPA